MSFVQAFSKDFSSFSSSSIDARTQSFIQMVKKVAPSSKDASAIQKNNSQSYLSEEELEKLQLRYFKLNFPLDSLLKDLEKSIIGQTQSVKDILFAVYNNQFLNMLEDLSAIDNNIKRIQTIALGPSGVGKTKTISKIAELFNVPYVKFNATQLTASGYVGSDVNMILSSLVEVANGDIEAAQRGIIFIDEVDKKVSTGANNTVGRDINGTAVQEELLKLLEPSIIYLGSKHVPFDTHSLTIIAGGRFKGIEEIRDKRLKGPKIMGFSQKSENNDINILSQETAYIPEDLIEFGFLDEFVGRFSLITEFKPLTFDNYLDIIFSEDSILQQYLQVFKVKEVSVYIDPIHYTRIAQEAIKMPTGVRYLELKLMQLLQPLLYQAEQHYVPGICEIDYDGNYFWMFEDSTCNF